MGVSFLENRIDITETRGKDFNNVLTGMVIRWKLKNHNTIIEVPKKC